MEFDVVDVHQLEFCMFECAILEIEKKLKNINERLFSILEYEPIENIKSRIKSSESIIRKLKNNQLPLSYDSIIKNLHDIAGVRIVCSFIDNIYMILDYITQDQDIEIVEIKDYVKNPKNNGYRSLHLIIRIPIGFDNYREKVTVEIQIRTVAMDFWATLEHKLIYKSIFSEKTHIIQDELKCYAKVINDMDNKITEIKNQIDDID